MAARAVRVQEGETEYVVRLAVEEFAADELRVEVRGREVTVSGAQRETATGRRLPFLVRACLEESFRLPDEADAAALTATYRRGQLDLHVPRRRLAPRVVAIATDVDPSPRPRPGREVEEPALPGLGIPIGLGLE